MTKKSFYKFLSPLLKKTPHKSFLLLAERFQRSLKIMIIPVNSIEAGADNPLGHRSFVNLIFCCKFIFLIQTHRRPLTLP